MCTLYTKGFAEKKGRDKEKKTFICIKDKNAWREKRKKLKGHVSLKV